MWMGNSIRLHGGRMIAVAVPTAREIDLVITLTFTHRTLDPLLELVAGSGEVFQRIWT
jgi:hypothetical protein